MQFSERDNIIEDFDLSIVIPFYKKLEEFKHALPINQFYFQRNGIEVILVMDDPAEEKELKEFTCHFPFINWKIVINRKRHKWRNPSKALNVGMRTAEKKFILVLSPETELINDLIYRMRYILDNYHKCYVIGDIAFVEYNYKINNESHTKLNWLPYGSFMTNKKYLEAIGGYAENYLQWGGEDDNIRRRLELFGIRRMYLPEARAIHREENVKGSACRVDRFYSTPIRLMRKTLYPLVPVTNDGSWGKDFGEIIMSWKEKLNNRVSCLLFLKNFRQYWVSSNHIFNQSYKIIALIQVKNEKSHIPAVLQHLDHFCDGIILLDDGSTDGTYQKAFSSKLLLKVQKEPKIYFDDLENRNLLLKLAHFFRSDWLFFMDADERFDTRYADLYTVTDNEINRTVCFYLVHLWDSEETYRVNLPEKSNGLLLRWRMFKNIGFMQIHSNRELHFPAIPYRKERMVANILLKHYGNLSKENRRKKYSFYTRQDIEGIKQGHDYRYLLDEKVKLEYVNMIKLIPVEIHSRQV